MTSYRVSPELILDIADHCDRATLRTLMQASKASHYPTHPHTNHHLAPPVRPGPGIASHINALISNNERSIAAAKLKTFLLPPLGEVLSSEDERRCRITGKYSFATIQEMDLRERRMSSILDNSGFLLTDDIKPLGMTDDSLARFKAGLKRGLYITDRLADLETRPEVRHVQNNITLRLSSLQVGGDSVGGAVNENDLDKIESFDDEVMLQHDAEIEAQHSAVMVHRNLQFEMIHELATLDLAWLLTLGEGAIKGCTRYFEKMFLSDPAGTQYKVVAFKEELLRKGSFILWAFVRGVGSMDAFAKNSLKQTGEEIMGFEIGQHQNCGLSLVVHQEMRQRVLEEIRRKDPLFVDDDEEELSPARVMAEAHRMIGEEIGRKNWHGYSSIVYPPVE
ncbi:hypothetical protein INS49_010353 [Diaporthe citri]|uniref:uncharacterized protein n=1 Tax=Diaporthe citri TaxID=83186 RepID=UPI001C824FCA|nr:uncharacterized protein INS49_010353 [Diaporthe citri]KAG6362124.1 hypothetical protein INS49_010353 [Diaporthe citri]